MTSIVRVRQYPLRHQRVKPFPQDDMADAGTKAGSVQCIHLSNDCWKNQLNWDTGVKLGCRVAQAQLPESLLGHLQDTLMSQCPTTLKGILHRPVKSNCGFSDGTQPGQQHRSFPETYFKATRRLSIRNTPFPPTSCQKFTRWRCPWQWEMLSLELRPVSPGDGHLPKAVLFSSIHSTSLSLIIVWGHNEPGSKTPSASFTCG